MNSQHSNVYYTLKADCQSMIHYGMSVELVRKISLHFYNEKARPGWRLGVWICAYLRQTHKPDTPA